MHLICIYILSIYASYYYHHYIWDSTLSCGCSQADSTHTPTHYHSCTTTSDVLNHHIDYYTDAAQHLHPRCLLLCIRIDLCLYSCTQLSNYRHYSTANHVPIPITHCPPNQYLLACHCLMMHVQFYGTVIVFPYICTVVLSLGCTFYGQLCPSPSMISPPSSPHLSLLLCILLSTGYWGSSHLPMSDSCLSLLLSVTE